MRALVLAHLASTLAMAGVIWTVQLVHYPGFSGVGADGWPAYAALHGRRITPLVFPLMSLELLTAVLLVWLRPASVPAWMAWVGLVLVGVIWAATAFLSVPLHAALAGAFSADAHARLVATNWVRTAAWTLRAGLVLAMAARLMR